ncbi:hypothetical protein [Moorena producens]|uniref:hypothetical protein n=1 Tax=Moorena producens TaxID=1155739 RepID=UPI003C77646C
MFLLALNLAVSALYRYPWRGARKIGFALTHLGIIVIIAGSAAVIHLGVEGMLPLRTDTGSNNQIRVEGELLEVMTPSSELQQADVLIKPDGSVIPKQIGKLSLLDYSDNTIKTVSFTEGATADNLAVDNPAVRLRLKSDRMGQTLERYLAVAPVAYSKVGIGPAELEIIQVDTVATGKGKSLLSPPSRTKPESLGKHRGNLKRKGQDRYRDYRYKTSSVIPSPRLLSQSRRFLARFPTRQQQPTDHGLPTTEKSRSTVGGIHTRRA